MKELLLLMGHLMSSDQIVDQLDEAIQEWKLIKTAENLNKVQAAAMLLLSKEVTEKEGIEETMARMRRSEQLEDAFTKERVKQS